MEWTQKRVEALFHSVEESQHLDFKAGAFLRKDCRDSLTKHVVGFANSDGGKLIIGVEEGKGELKHFATGFSGVNGLEWSKERLEALIESNISPRITNIKIYPIRIDGEVSNSVYVIDIPKSDTCHQASDNIYYYRANFSTQPMRDFQIRDVMNRVRSSRLSLRVAIEKGRRIGFSIANMGGAAVKNWTAEIILCREAVEIDDNFVLKNGVTSNNIIGYGDYGEIKSDDIIMIEGRECYIYNISRLNPGSSEVILPRTALEVFTVGINHIFLNRLAIYWQIDSDDGKRTYGFLSETADEIYEFNGSDLDNSGGLVITE